MLRRGLYNVCIALLVLFHLPKYLWNRICHGKYRRSLSYRLGIKQPKIPPLISPVIWIHAVSLGEAKASIAFAMEAKKTYPNASIVVSSATETGFNEVAKSMPFITTHFFLPFDFSFLIRPLVQQIKPDLTVFVEGDLWPNFLHAITDCHSQILLINGKISERSLKRYAFFKRYAHQIFSQLTYSCVQNTLYLERFQKLNIPLERLSVTGNIKFDIPTKSLSADEVLAFKNYLGISSTDRIIVIGSTHEKEEALILGALHPLLEQDTNIKILLAPRHPERFSKVEQFLLKNYVYSTWSTKTPKTGKEKVVLIDTLGKLTHCYQIAEVAIVGGSFVDIGGHNLLEPSEYGVPVLFGPYVYKQTELARCALQEGIGFEVSLDSLAPKVLEILYNPYLQQEIANRAKSLFNFSKGASLKSWAQAQLLLDKKVNILKS